MIAGLGNFYFSRIFVYNDNGNLTCGTELIQDLFKSLGGTSTASLDEYIELVRQYDTWDWTKTNNLLSKDMNLLYRILSRDDFYNNIMDKIRTSFKIILNDTDKLLLKIEHQRDDEYIKEKMKNIVYKVIKGRNCAIVFAENNVNEISQELYSNKDVDIAVIVGPNNINYRTNKNVDVNEFAKYFGGGGHAKASGSLITKESKDIYLKSIFKE